MKVNEIQPARGPVGSPGALEILENHGEPLSAALRRMFAADATGELTLNRVLLGLAGRGPLALIVVLCLPFMTPISLPGVSNVFGVAIAFLGWRISTGKPAHLPSAIGDRRMEGPLLGRIVRAGLKGLGWLERGLRPRPTFWVTSTYARRLNGALIVWGALLLALPLPPTIPCSNLVPAAAIILITLSMAEEDGLTLWFGYAALVGSTAYLGTMIWLESFALLELWHRIHHLVIHWLH